MKRRKLVQELLTNGFEADGGTNHEHFRKRKAKSNGSAAPGNIRSNGKSDSEAGKTQIETSTTLREDIDMLYINEFEFFEDEGMICAFPFDREGATCGVDFDDAVAMAADWLYETVKYEVIDGDRQPKVSLNHKPQHGGRVMAIAVDFDLNRVDAVTAADAARILGVTTARIAQMCESGQLTSWKDGSKRLILRESVEARLANTPKAGRPRKTAIA